MISHRRGAEDAERTIFSFAVDPRETGSAFHAFSAPLR